MPSPFLKGVRLERSSLPRVPAPPEILRTERIGALGRDGTGYVGLRADDKPMNLAVIGLQGSGKSSVLRAESKPTRSTPTA